MELWELYLQFIILSREKQKTKKTYFEFIESIIKRLFVRPYSGNSSSQENLLEKLTHGDDSAYLSLATEAQSQWTIANMNAVGFGKISLFHHNGIYLYLKAADPSDKLKQWLHSNICKISIRCDRQCVFTRSFWINFSKYSMRLKIVSRFNSNNNLHFGINRYFFFLFENWHRTLCESIVCVFPFFCFVW